MHRTKAILIGAAGALALASCRGEISNKPPVHIVPNMDFQDKLKAQSASKFPGWTDGRGMRLPVEGTIARGKLRALDPDPQKAKLYTFKVGDKYVTDNPLPRTAEILARGRERFGIHCAVCHGLNGRGLGIVGRRLAVKPPSFVPKDKESDPLARHEDERIAKLTDGELYETITNGKGTMQPYRYQVAVEDRWAIVHYIRAMQLRARN